jgi:hypothetical protein
MNQSRFETSTVCRCKVPKRRHQLHCKQQAAADQQPRSHRRFDFKHQKPTKSEGAFPHLHVQPFLLSIVLVPVRLPLTFSDVVLNDSSHIARETSNSHTVETERLGCRLVVLLCC